MQYFQILYLKLTNFDMSFKVDLNIDLIPVNFTEIFIFWQHSRL